MWKIYRPGPKDGLFLLKCGLFIDLDNAANLIDKTEIIGYCLPRGRIMAINSSENKLKWSFENVSIRCLPYYDYPRGSTIQYQDLSGDLNTDYIIDHCNESGLDLRSYYPAAYYCRSYSPGYKDGEWYLPSIGELELLYDRINEFIYSCMKSNLGTNIGVLSRHNYFWSSTVNSVNLAWVIDSSFYYKSYYDPKEYDCYVLPFLRS